MVFSTPGGSATQPWSHFKGSAARSGRYRPLSNIDLGRYVDAVYRDLLGRPADGGGLVYWTSLLDNGMPPTSFTRQIAVAPEWIGHTVDVLYNEVFGRAPDPSGRNYWINVIGAGNRVAAVASNLYGSDEWFFSHGGNNDAYVDALYQAILRRPRTRAGRTGSASSPRVEREPRSPAPSTRPMSPTPDASTGSTSS